eukprot:11412861-Prorocentrum_lima.AAC.1
MLCGCVARPGAATSAFRPELSARPGAGGAPRRTAAPILRPPSPEPDGGARPSTAHEPAR